ncbi:hypothetical protein FZW96_07220 [Bacillus sp. BGMRC 2118]|nr:hypothetical protein FZW96_07220 [Bacillus sp. BGMRC 2118]
MSWLLGTGYWHFPGLLDKTGLVLARKQRVLAILRSLFAALGNVLAILWVLLDILQNYPTYSAKLGQEVLRY